MASFEDVHYQPVYLHASWRASSTYVWAKFRSEAGTYCYFEPLAEQLATATTATIDRFIPWSFAHHPPLDAPYHDEFRPLLKPGGGIAHFPEAPVYERYRLQADDEAPELRRYFANLERFAGALGKIPVFGLVRSALRGGWFRRHCPGTHLYIRRNCRMQFLSCLRQATKGNWYFLERGLVILGHNQDDPIFAPLCRWLGLPRYDGLGQSRDTFYRDLAHRTEPAFLYAVNYSLDRLAQRDHQDQSDWVIDVDLMAQSAATRIETETQVFNLTGLKLSFADCSPESYDDLLAGSESMFRDVEAAMDGLLAQTSPCLP